MIISIPRERKANEKRVAITPEGTRELVALGANILIEEGAGLGSGFEDSQYIQAGAKISTSLKNLMEPADIFLKVKEPAPEEFNFLHPNMIAFSFLHPAGSRELTDALLISKVIGLDYDLIENENGKFHILEPMSVIAGKLSIHVASELMLSHRGGKGFLLDGLRGVPPASVLVLGAGVSGFSAAKRANDIGAKVTLLDINQNKLDKAKALCPEITTLISDPTIITSQLPLHDVIVGAVLVAGAKAPILIKKEHLPTMKKGSIFIDIAIDQGGIAETSKTTSLNDPVYTEDGVIHYCVPNMPAMVPLSSTIALTQETLPWLKKLCVNNLDTLANKYPGLKKGIVCKNGVLCNRAIADTFGLEWSAP
jgi:alanine dehydrogenase